MREDELQELLPRGEKESGARGSIDSKTHNVTGVSKISEHKLREIERGSLCCLM